ncbi:hypothetical protein TCAL_16618 [Tigriopus californicus]|uniref:Uncharacterized protein n=1 Tax=Tigriopus californicus TaxID=6832 RepID=A0A553NAX5_TIGCA|nr:hypothetical protein TCAL_16618 [Tigriopus californicus]
MTKKLSSRKISAPSFATSLRNLRGGGSNSNNGNVTPPPPTPPTGEDHTSGGISLEKLRIDTGLAHHSSPNTTHQNSGDMDFGGDDEYSPPIYFTTDHHHHHPLHRSTHSLLNTPVVQIATMEDAILFIEDLKEKLRAQGNQVITYRRKLRQQKVEISDLRYNHRKQLEDITSQLLHFESSLRSKERALEDTLSKKDQVILKQQRVIKRLLKKCYGSDFASTRTNPAALADEAESVELALEGLTSLVQPCDGDGQGSLGSDGSYHKIDFEQDAQNDSDSAIMLEDNLAEVRLLVPTLSIKSNSSTSSGTDTCNEIRIIRSISDVVKVNGQQQRLSTVNTSLGDGNSPNKTAEPPKQLSGRKTKEERRISNRQKLMSLKRHSGFLKRPEILETVYSVEEDGDLQQQQAQNQAQQQSQGGMINNLSHNNNNPHHHPHPHHRGAILSGSMESSDNNKETNKGVDTVESQAIQRQFSSMVDSPLSSRRGSCILTGFRYRLDSDLAGSDDYSTDDDSTRIFYSETTDGSCGGTSCSQPCSRRSSYGTGICSLPCSRRSSYGHTPGSSVAACECCGSPGLTGSRRSSCGSQNNLSTANSDENNDQELKVQSAYNRVMSSHKAVLKPKDVKFKRINKAKSRSLEELRGKLRWHPGGIVTVYPTPLVPKPVQNLREPRKRGVLQHCASLDQSSSTMGESLEPQM